MFIENEPRTTSHSNEEMHSHGKDLTTSGPGLAAVDYEQVPAVDPARQSESKLFNF